MFTGEKKTISESQEKRAQHFTSIQSIHSALFSLLARKLVVSCDDWSKRSKLRRRISREPGIPLGFLQTDVREKI